MNIIIDDYLHEVDGAETEFLLNVYNHLEYSIISTNSEGILIKLGGIIHRGLLNYNAGGIYADAYSYHFREFVTSNNIAVTSCSFPDFSACEVLYIYGNHKDKDDRLVFIPFAYIDQLKGIIKEFNEFHDKETRKNYIW